MHRFTALLASALLLVAAPFATAQPYGSASPDLGAAKKRAAVCFACHGEDGISKSPGIPSLAGQDRSYLEKALSAYRGAQLRQDPTMTAMAKPLSDADIINIAAYFNFQARMSDGQTAANMIETNARIQPVGVVYVSSNANSSAMKTDTAVPAKAAPRTGEQIFNAVCSACHGSGVMGAPKLGDKQAWAPRVAQGKDTLLQHALHGYKAMPPHGTCGDCSDDDIKSVIAYMLSKVK